MGVLVQAHKTYFCAGGVREDVARVQSGWTCGWEVGEGVGGRG